ncbi:MAG: hypothetical protein C5B45_00575 [Chlamydiae bacterium]|nr:MAG: hypothetical protein C5B45_00575 [Chlamydiota bacterium]
MVNSKEKQLFQLRESTFILYYYVHSSGTNKLMQIIQQQWLRSLDLFIKIKCLEFGVAIDKLIKRDYSMGFAC